MEEGDFTVELSEMLTKRKDEIGQMAGTAVRMQHSLRDLVQRDSLTGLYNRHYGEIWMKQVKEEARDTGEPFSIAIADIDFSKSLMTVMDMTVAIWCFAKCRNFCRHR